MNKKRKKRKAFVLWKIINKGTLLAIFIFGFYLFLLAEVSSRDNSTTGQESELITAWDVSKYGVFLVRISPHLDWIWRDTTKNSVFGHFSRSECPLQWRGDK